MGGYGGWQVAAAGACVERVVRPTGDAGVGGLGPEPQRKSNAA